MRLSAAVVSKPQFQKCLRGKLQHAGEVLVLKAFFFFSPNVFIFGNGRAFAHKPILPAGMPCWKGLSAALDAHGAAGTLMGRSRSGSLLVKRPPVPFPLLLGYKTTSPF